MTHQELINKIAEKNNQEPSQVAELLTNLADLLVTRLVEGDNIDLPHVGVLSTVKENEKVIVNPANNQERYLVPPRILPTLYPDYFLNKQVND